MTVRKLMLASVLGASTLAPAAIAQPADTSGFARIFTDHAVLQRDRPIVLWGHAAPGAPVTVSMGGAQAQTVAQAQGAWRVTLPPMPAGGPYDLALSVAGATTKLHDIAVGDVFLCGGQSNMEFPARFSTGAWGGLTDVDDPDLRFVTIEHDSAATARDDLRTPVAWKPVTAQSVGEASAACYYMASSLRKTQHVPIGFIASDWGGTTIQSWISAPALATMPAYRAGAELVSAYARNPLQALATEGARIDRWWDEHDPAARDQRDWSSPDFDDSGWSTIVPQGPWKQQGPADLADFDGAVWFRSSVTLTAQQARMGGALQLGPIDTYDSTWINGQRVGAGATSWAWRDYLIPPGTLKAGRNVVAVKVLNDGSGGGLTGHSDVRGIRLASGDLVPLETTWRYRKGMRGKGLSIAPFPWVVPTSDATLYNGMIAPLAGYCVKAVAWYQGEANTDAPGDYADLLRLLMADWRKALAAPQTPFLVVQLANFGPVSARPVESGWAALRDAQRRAVQADGHAALVVSIDIGDPQNIHPTQKAVLGERLARAARSVAYHEPVAPGGPQASGVERRGSDLIVHFHKGAGLQTYSANVAIGFEACEGAACHFVPGTVEGDTIVLQGAGTSGITRVRYAWADSPYVNLYGKDDLPAVPFEMEVR